MKLVILAGGYGTRMGEESKIIPKPMFEIGGKPIIWHIMKIYSFYGINDFIICCGHKGDKIKQFFSENKDPWNVVCEDTGLETMTGDRLKKIQKLVDGTFCFTYGDTLSDVNIKKLINFHNQQGCLATVTACKPPEKYGILEIEENKVTSFKEKIPRDDIWVNGGFFVLEPDIFEYIKNDSTTWEMEPMEKLSKDNQLSAFKHDGFYHHMDTVKEQNLLNKLWDNNEAKWKVW